MTMTLDEAMYKRRSVRAFLKKEVEEEKIQKLLEYAMAGPSACNSRPWEFYVVKSAENRSKLRKTSRHTDFNSPVIVIVAANEKFMLAGERRDFWIQDCSAAVENILLGATALGLGSCWCGVYPKTEAVENMRSFLGLDTSIYPLALIHIGYPAQSPEPRTQFDQSRVHIL